MSNIMYFKRQCLSATALSAILISPFAAIAADDADSRVMLEEITVTASKRAESIQDVPYNITAITGNSLEKLGVIDLTKLSRMIPGMSTAERGPRENTTVVIRGLTVDKSFASGSSGSGTVASYINDTSVRLDFKLLDINRVEVLRGPQGTLYGAGSLGGTIRYITNKPDPTEVTADVHGKLSTTKESSGLSYDMDAVINLPIIQDKMALRAVLGYEDEKGFIDYNHVLADPGNSMDTKKVKDANYGETTSARASILLNVTDDVEAIANYYYQRTKTGGRQTASIPFTGDKYASPSRYEEPNNRISQMFSFDLTWDLGFAELFSTTAYQKRTELGQRDQTDLLLNLDFGYDSFPLFSGFTEEKGKTTSISEEIRLTSKNDGPLQWIVGAFYTSENEFIVSKEFTPGLPAFWGIDRPDELEFFIQDIAENREYAFFGEVSYNITEDLKITGGVRHFNLKQDRESCVGFPLYFGPEGTGINVDCSGSGSIEGEPYPDGDVLGPDVRTYGANKPIKDTFFKFNMDYHIEDDIMIYATFSQGFRRGGSNPLPEGGQVGAIPDFFLSYGPDTVDNYELGIKSQLLDNRLTFNANIYMINWQQLQLFTNTGPELGFLPVIVNGGKARSSGVEIEATALIAENIIMNVAYSYTDAHLSEDAPLISDFTATGDPIFALDGDSVPLVPKHKLYVSLDYFQSLANDNGELKYHIDASFTGEMPSVLRPNAADYELIPGYEIINASISYQRDNWSVTLFADNLFNNYATYGGRHLANQPIAGLQGTWNFVNRPRTLGLEFRGSF